MESFVYRVNTRAGLPISEYLRTGIMKVCDPRIFSGKKVLLKPNFCGPGSAPHLYSMSDPQAVIETGNLAKSLGATQVTIADNPAGYVKDTSALFRVLNIEQMARSAGFRFLDLRNQPYARFGDLSMSRAVPENDVIINITLPKTHHQVQPLSLCLKNLGMGLISQYERDRFHASGTGILEGICKVNNAIRRNKLVIDILDARRAQEWLGPHFGDPVDPGFMLFGRDPVAMDSTAARLLGFVPENIGLLKTGQDSALGKIDSPVDGDRCSLFPLRPSPIWEFSSYRDFVFLYWLEKDPGNLGCSMCYSFDKLAQRYIMQGQLKLNFSRVVTSSEASDAFFTSGTLDNMLANLQKPEINVDIR